MNACIPISLRSPCDFFSPWLVYCFGGKKKRPCEQIRNPVNRVLHPEWLDKAIRAADDKHKQKKIKDIFSKAPEKSQASQAPLAMDIEDIVGGAQATTRSSTYVATVSKIAKDPCPGAPLVSRSVSSLKLYMLFFPTPLSFFFDGVAMQTPRMRKLARLSNHAQIERKTTNSGSTFKRPSGKSKGSG